jgi:hypothetical protein
MTRWRGAGLSKGPRSMLGMYIYIHAFMYVYVYLFIHIEMFIYLYMGIDMQPLWKYSMGVRRDYICTYTYIYMYTHQYIYISRYRHSAVLFENSLWVLGGIVDVKGKEEYTMSTECMNCRYTCVYVYICIYIYMYIYIYMNVGIHAINT